MNIRKLWCRLFSVHHWKLYKIDEYVDEATVDYKLIYRYQCPFCEATKTEVDNLSERERIRREAFLKRVKQSKERQIV